MNKAYSFAKKVWRLAQSPHTKLRRLVSLKNDSFVFDGTDSDIAQQLYVRYHTGDSVDRVNLTSIPRAVSDRLDQLHINFTDLLGLVQRAVLWDTGFAISPGNDPVQIWTLYRHTMGRYCVVQVGNSQHPFKICTGYQILNISRCVVDVFEDMDAGTYIGMFWATGGDSNAIPNLILREHYDISTNFSVDSIHTAPSSWSEPGWDECPPEDTYVSLTVPCQRRDLYSGDIGGLQTPIGSAWVTMWLKEEFGEDNSYVKVIVPILVVAIIMIGVCWFGRRRRAKRQDNELSTGNSDRHGERRIIGDNIDETELRTMALANLHGVSISTPDPENAGSNRTLQILLESEYLTGKRIAFESLIFEKALSKGASGEVWVCEYNGQKVAAKRLLQTKTQNAGKVQAFAEEIELSASLVHPIIVEFIGVAWNMLSNLVMVLEFFPRGNLQNYLQQSKQLLSWSRDKTHTCIGIAQALEYLHQRVPPLIHRDLKSNNILLTDNLEPKIIDFGVSRGRIDIAMTAGVGTPYWTAPEILQGKRYTEKADIYSFGVVLSELDTCEIPFSDAVTEGGEKMKPFQILHGVIAGTLRPSFSKNCPPQILQVAQTCLVLDPADRPTAKLLVENLENCDCLTQENDVV